MPNSWPAKPPQYRVCYPVNTDGTTWLCESDLVFVKKRPYAVLSWSKTEEGTVPEQWLPLDRRLLKHDRAEDPVFRYEGEIHEPPKTEQLQ
jgi:hypothetical protein